MEHKNRLILLAKQAFNNAVAPFSKFRVGAVIETKEGKSYTGCNIEVSSYGLTICAERVAIFKALSENEKHFVNLFVYTETENFCPPCGACRQVIWDFAPELTVVLINKKNELKTLTIADLYPEAFGSEFLASWRADE